MTGLRTPELNRVLGRRPGPPPLLQRAFARWHPRRRTTPLTAWQRLSPARLLVLSFAGLIAVGTFGFRWLPGLYTGEALGWVDALFMATSAVCITGLSVVNLGADLTVAGQLWVLLLVQAGALGLLTLASGVLLSAGRRLSLRHAELVSGSEAAPIVDYRRLVRQVLRVTATVELTGAILLYLCWVDDFGWAGAAWPAVFHAVTAFCSAGFSTFENGLHAQRAAWAPLAVLTTMVVIGSLGFLVIDELWRILRAWQHRRRSPRLSLHSRLVLATTAIVTVVGTITVFVFERTYSLAGLPAAYQWLNSFFAAGAARTAGFSTIDYGLVTAPTALAMSVLMFIGGAPASTAGGVKVTSVALVLALAWARLRGESYVTLWDRSVPTETVGRAMAVLVIGVSVLGLLFSVLLAVEPGAESQAVFLPYMFESVSALGTAGLSMNLTPALSPAGRLVLVVLMFIGRVGLLTIAAAIAVRGRRNDVRFAYEDVAVA